MSILTDSKTREAVVSLVQLVAGAYLFAFCAGQLGVLPAPLSQYGLVVQGAIVSGSALAVGALFAVAVVCYIKWRYSHLSALRDGGGPA